MRWAGEEGEEVGSNGVVGSLGRRAAKKGGSEMKVFLAKKRGGER